MGDGWLRFGQGCSYSERGFVLVEASVICSQNYSGIPAV
jgi:hypothetical protein